MIPPSFKLSLKLSKPSDKSAEIMDKKRRISSPEVLLVGTLAQTATSCLDTLIKYSVNNRLLAEPFMDLPNPDLYTDYYKVVSEPISLNEIRCSIGSIGKFADFKNRVYRLFSNCKLYNDKASIIYKDCLALKECFDSEVEKVQSAHRRALEVAPELFEAIEKGSLKTVASLLPLFPTLDFLFPTTMANLVFEWSPLHSCAYFGQTSILQLLAQKGVNVELEDGLYHGRALAWAAYGGQPKFCSLLMETLNPDIHATNIHGQTAKDLIKDPGNTAWASVFVDTDGMEGVVLQNDPATANAAVTLASLTSLAQSSPKRETKKDMPTLTVTLGSHSSNTNADPKPKEVEKPIEIVQLPRENRLARLSSAPLDPDFMIDSDIEEVKVSKNEKKDIQGLLQSLGIQSSDHSFKMSLDVSLEDPKRGFDGHSVVVPNSVKSVNFRVSLNTQPFDIPTANADGTVGRKKPFLRYGCSGFHTCYMTFNMQTDPKLPPQLVTQQSFEPLHFKYGVPGGQGDIQDCVVPILADGLNTFEIVLAASLYSHDEGNIVLVNEVYQSILLVLQKQS